MITIPDKETLWVQYIEDNSLKYTLPYITTIKAHSICTINLYLALTGLTSSIIPNNTIMNVDIRIDNICVVISPYNIYPIRKDVYIASPPNLGIGLVCTFLSFGISIAPICLAITFARGTNNKLIKNVTKTISKIL